jgi:hypothetical protein
MPVLVLFIHTSRVISGQYYCQKKLGLYSPKREKINLEEDPTRILAL